MFVSMWSINGPFFKLRLDKYQSFQDLNGKHFIGFDFKDRSIKNENKTVYQQIFHTFVKEIYEIK